MSVASTTLAAGWQGSKKQDSSNLTDFWHRGELDKAVTEATKLADKNATSKNAVICWLEQATVLRAAGKFEASNKAFDAAAAKIDDYAAKAKIRLSSEAVSIVASPASLPYEGRGYDGIMLETYRALNYLSLGLADQARPALIRAYQREQDAVEDNKRVIARTQEAAAQAKDKEKEATAHAQNDEKFKGQVSNLTADLNDLKAYGDYVNPFAVYLDGLYFMVQSTGTADLERAHKSLERCVSFAENNDYLKQDLAVLDGIIAGKPMIATTYVIFETGSAPEREESTLDIPLFGSGSSYTAAAFPKLALQPDFAPNLKVLAAGNNYVTAPVASMDSVIGNDFKSHELPLVQSKTIGLAVGKAIGISVGNRAADQASPLLGIFTKKLTDVVSKKLNAADTRTWTTLPKEFQLARFATPADRKLEFSTSNGVKTSVLVSEGSVNLVYIKSITADASLLVNQIILK